MKGDLLGLGALVVLGGCFGLGKVIGCFDSTPPPSIARSQPAPVHAPPPVAHAHDAGHHDAGHVVHHPTKHVEPAPVVDPPPHRTCCKHCSAKSYACGDSCIPLSHHCKHPPGCACD